MSLLELLKRPIAKLSVADLEAGLAKATAAVEAAERAAAEAESAYRAALLEPDSDAPIAARGKIGDAAMARDRAQAQVDALNDRITAVRARDAEDARRRIYDAAKAEADAAADRLRREYPKAAKTIVDLIVDLAAAEAAVVAVNGALPIGAEPLTSPESSMRDVPAKARKELSETIVEKWVKPDGSIVPLEWEKHVRSSGRGEHALSVPTPAGMWASTQSSIPVVRRAFREVTFLPSAAGASATPLAATVSLPGLEPLMQLWEPISIFSFTPDDVAARHAELQAQRIDWTAPLAPRVELEPINTDTGEVTGPAQQQAAPPLLAPARPRRTARAVSA